MKRAAFVALVLACATAYLLLFVPPDWAIAVVLILALLAVWVGGE